MTDEEYVFHSECADRKRTARGSFNKRSHAGKGGRVKMPSDYMTKKERDKMNGEVQSYNLNCPMKWAQFKQMPDDIKREYLSSIISKYNPQQKALAEMFGVNPVTLSAKCRELGMSRWGDGHGARKGRNDAFEAWVSSATVAEPEQESIPDDIPTAEPAQRPHGGGGGTGKRYTGILGHYGAGCIQRGLYAACNGLNAESGNIMGGGK